MVQSLAYNVNWTSIYSIATDINNQLNDNAIFVAIISAALASLISLYGGWRLHRKQVDNDAFQEHFKQLKEETVSPLLSLLGLPDTFPSRESIILSPINNYHIDNELCKDVLFNHYPQIISKWDQLVNINSSIRETDTNINGLIDRELRRALGSAEIHYAVHEGESPETRGYIFWIS